MLTISGFACADRFDGVKSEGRLISNIMMTVADITCQINDGSGISQQVSIPIVTLDELKSGKEKSAEALLLIDCRSSTDQPGKIKISLSPVGNSAVFDGNTMTTSLPGLGLRLSWKDRTLPSLILGNTNYSTHHLTGDVWDFSLVASPVLLGKPDSAVGNYSGTLQIKIQYT